MGEVVRRLVNMNLLEGETHEGDEIKNRKPFGSVESQFSDDMTPFDIDFQIQPQQGSNTRETLHLVQHSTRHQIDIPAQPIHLPLKALSPPNTLTDVKIPENSFHLLDNYLTYTHICSRSSPSSTSSEPYAQ
jgi:hypothetical protein